MATPLINGKAFDYVDIQVQLLGAELVGVTELNYTEEQPKENNFGLGSYAESRGRGAINASGSIGLTMNEVEALREVVPTGSLLDIPPFNIVVVFGNVQNPQTHVLRNCEFIDDGMEGAQGDTNLTRVFGLVMSNVRYR